MASRLTVVYRVRGSAASAAERAEALAVEQSVEMPVSAIADAYVREQIVGRVLGIDQVDDEVHDVRIGLAPETIGDDAGQLFNMLFGNSSLLDDVVLQDVDLPDDLVRAFGGPRHGIDGLRRRIGGRRRALTGSALKPQGLPPDDLARLAARFAQGGIDVVKDDHGLADQAYSPFAARITAVAAALRDVADRTGHRTCYVPSVSGDLDRCSRQIDLARGEGLDTVMVAPMIAGPANVQALVRRYPDIAFIAHPTLAGAARLAPLVLYGRLFRLIGIDGVIFPNHGGRFGYSADTCRALADAARGPWRDLAPVLPIPAGGMTPDRAGEMLDFYGRDVLLLIGGALLRAGDRLIDATAAFVRAVDAHTYGD
ncbi:MAG: ribulose 1,5-bisphosphate carboxylase [Acidobacteria bacterium SCN 69-37]|mgnify:CR=1 FL=1|nr:MAG: ribulose 1,5-bisphosphate carboxylase [Acidobacteria bacterium SCN 69-37]